jgi:ribosome biogenesis GTPase / thiamine phosphate phosphatase
MSKIKIGGNKLMNENLQALYKLGLSKDLEMYFNENFKGYSLGRISIQYNNVYSIESINGRLLGSISGKMKYELENKEDYPVVGDWVVFKNINNENAVIHEILPRKTSILRKVAGAKSDQQILATNVDKIFITMALNNDFNLRRLERYINISWDSGAKPVILLTKSDLCKDIEDRLKDIEEVAIGIDIIVTSMVSGEGLEAIEKNIEYTDTVVFIGSSGVGKSSIINRLLGEKVQLTSEVDENDKGRHTTTHRALFTLPLGGVIIDTPGMRELQLSQGDLDLTFQDIEDLAKACYFKDCQHQSEPRCAVKDAIKNGDLSKKRFNNYKKLKRELLYEEKRKLSKEKRKKRGK